MAVPDATLRVLTFDPNPAPILRIADPGPCSGEYSCICDHCTAERISRVRRGIRRAPQPWDSLRKAA